MPSSIGRPTPSFSRIFATAAAGLCATALAAGTALADPPGPSAAKSAPSCFFANEWDGWRAAGPKVIYLRVSVNDIYRIDLATPAPELEFPMARLISEVRGGPAICAPVDLELYVSDGYGFREPLFVDTLTRLTPAQAAALPAKYRP